MLCRFCLLQCNQQLVRANGARRDFAVSALRQFFLNYPRSPARAAPERALPGVYYRLNTSPITGEGGPTAGTMAQ